MLTGRNPFAAPDVIELIHQIIHDEPQPPRQLALAVPRRLDAVPQGAGQGPGRPVHDRRRPGRGPPGGPGRPRSRPGPGPPPAAAAAPAPPAGPRLAWAAERRRVAVLRCGCDLFRSEAAAEYPGPRGTARGPARLPPALPGGGRPFRHPHPADRERAAFCFGFPVAFEDAAGRAVRAGLGVLDRLGPFNDDLFPRRKGIRLSATAAAHSDQAIVQQLDGGGLSIVGKVLDTVEQLERLADGAVVASAEVVRLVRDGFEVAPLGPTGFRVVRQAGGAATGPARPTLVGRDRELSLLLERWERATEGDGQVVFVTGEPGIGKSRLVAALKEQVAAGSGLTDVVGPVVEWRADPYAQSSSLQPVVGWFNRHLGPADRMAAMTAHLAGLGFRDPAQVGLMAALLSVPVEGRLAPPELTPLARKERTLDRSSSGCASWPARRPLLFVVEDLHWADADDARVPRPAHRAGAPERPLALLTSRPDFAPPWRARAPDADRPGQARPPADGRAGRRQPGWRPAPAADRPIAEKTDGVPLFVEEFTPWRSRPGSWPRVAGDGVGPLLAGPAIPATLQDLLMARLDRMGSNREVVQLASALGREFSYDLLHAVCPLPSGPPGRVRQARPGRVPLPARPAAARHLPVQARPDPGRGLPVAAEEAPPAVPPADR